MLIIYNWKCKLEENIGTNNLFLKGEALLNLSLKSESKEEMLVKFDHNFLFTSNKTNKNTTIKKNT